MPGILTRSTGNFKTVLGLGPLQNAAGASNAYDTEHEYETDTYRASSPPLSGASPPPSKPRGRKLRARIPREQHSPHPTMPPPADIKTARPPRMLRVDPHDGPWSVSVAEASPHAFTLYVKSKHHSCGLVPRTNPPLPVRYSCNSFIAT